MNRIGMGLPFLLILAYFGASTPLISKVISSPTLATKGTLGTIRLNAERVIVAVAFPSGGSMNRSARYLKHHRLRDILDGQVTGDLEVNVWPGAALPLSR